MNIIKLVKYQFIPPKSHKHIEC